MSNNLIVALMWSYCVICAIATILCILTGHSFAGKSHLEFDQKANPTDFWIQIGGLGFSSVAAGGLAIWFKNSN